MDENIFNYKLEKCINCGTKTDAEDSEEIFCSQCGAPIVNRCSDYSCGNYLKPDAKFCKYCGASSIFKNRNLIDTPKCADDIPF